MVKRWTTVVFTPKECLVVMPMQGRRHRLTMLKEPYEEVKLFIKKAFFQGSKTDAKYSGPWVNNIRTSLVIYIR